MKVAWNVCAHTFCCNVVSSRSWQQAHVSGCCDFVTLDVTEHTAGLLSGISYSSVPYLLEHKFVFIAI